MCQRGLKIPRELSVLGEPPSPLHIQAQLLSVAFLIQRLRY